MSREISGEGGTAFVFDAETSDEENSPVIRSLSAVPDPDGEPSGL
jgi:hypothetical protein